MNAIFAALRKLFGRNRDLIPVAPVYDERQWQKNEFRQFKHFAERIVHP